MPNTPATHRMAEACYAWRPAIVPVAEHVAHLVADNTEKAIKTRTPLTKAKLASACDGIAANDVITEPGEAAEKMKYTKARARCATCGSTNLRLIDELCSWCATSTKTRAAWRTRRADVGDRGKAATIPSETTF
jgi:hypothetical protein